MRERLPLFVLLGSALTFVASLYLPWQEAVQSGSTGRGVLSLLNLFASGGGGTVDGRGVNAGVAASLAAVALFGIAAARLVGQSMIGDPPLVPIAFALCYFTIGSLVVLHAGETGSHVHYHFAYGAYFGVASAAVVVLVVPWIERETHARLSGAPEALVALLGVGLLVSLLLPWVSPFLGSATRAWLPGIDLPPAMLAAAGVLLLAAPSVRFGRLLYGAIAIAVLTGGAVDVVTSDTKAEYGAWMALGFSLALVAAAAFARRKALAARSALRAGLGAAVAAVFVVGLFLPWQQYCAPQGRQLGHGFGQCITTPGWALGEPAAVAGALALVVVFAAVAAAWPNTSIVELTLVITALTASVGVAVANQRGNIGSSIGYGAYVGFAAAALLLVVVLAGIRRPKLERTRVIDRAVPLAASVALFCAVALPLWSVLPERWSVQADVLRGWYSMAGLLVAVHLVRRWVESTVGRRSEVGELVLLPLALLALTGLELVADRSVGMTWGGGILVGLCVVLTVFGWVEQRGGLERLEVPEILRVDRLPGAET